MKQRVVRGSPFYSPISTNLIIAKGDSKQPLLIPHFFYFMLIKCGSRQPLSFLYLYQIVVAKGGPRQSLHFSYFHHFMVAKVARGSPFPSYISTKCVVVEDGSRQSFPFSHFHHFYGSKRWLEAAPSIPPMSKNIM